jgi:hypothetical protein
MRDRIVRVRRTSNDTNSEVSYGKLLLTLGGIVSLIVTLGGGAIALYVKGVSGDSAKEIRHEMADREEKLRKDMQDSMRTFWQTMPTKNELELRQKVVDLKFDQITHENVDLKASLSRIEESVRKAR